MPAAKANTKNVWSTVDDDSSLMTGAACEESGGNRISVPNRQGTLVRLDTTPSICRNYCALEADCNSLGQWVNVRYAW